MISLRSPQDVDRPTAIALGSFDGLHHGHRRVIAAVTGSEPALGPVPTIVSFWPHPREVLHGEARLRLDLPSEKLALLEPLGIRQLVLVPFDRALAVLTPEAFVEQVLVAQLAAQSIAVGENFRFGSGRSGDAQTLKTLGERHGMAVQVLPMLWDGPERVSSSRIRRALAAGDVAEARRLLERPYRFSGRVVRGRGLGRELGWPTANLQVDGRKFLPKEGVYAALAAVGDGPTCAAVMNLGPQPTVDPMAPSAVEVHLLDQGEELVGVELAGRELTVEPLAWLRTQMKFGNFEALSAQIAADAAQALQLGQAELAAMGSGRHG
ncbi:riboflavin biosynthesis protein RibF [Cyanobium sp. WAJ14-Wanaka]|uniref:riboflavin biosynthesis protein RibF n=1 Tax=Cyanobium sp. WAJ14-Wanaka TaxID=2823725 RepID=UPI0020CBFF60|nr:riboflavin biosynthesis protein RibF [Cyanobium sp. WAJ14-Wanaka]MCP9775122.1 riboflavin biosynthesis protein RibF [Cyanobium sp. WAJ14-Wanaka]